MVICFKVGGRSLITTPRDTSTGVEVLSVTSRVGLLAKEIDLIMETALSLESEVEDHTL
jgi:hypothetical protein